VKTTHEHNAWAADHVPSEPQHFHVEIRTLVLCLGALQLIADVFQVFGLSI